MGLDLEVMADMLDEYEKCNNEEQLKHANGLIDIALEEEREMTLPF